MHPKLIQVITKDVCDFFNLDECAVFDLKIEYGLKYLANRYQQEPEIMNALKNHSQFWSWWTELWAERDKLIMKRSEKKAYGFNYSYPLNRMLGSQPLMETRKVFTDETWEFYEDMHYWIKVKLYPNPVLVSACITEEVLDQQK